MQAHGMVTPEDRVFISIPEARKILYSAMSFFIGKEGRKVEWLPEYEKVAEWLSNNKGRGLFLFGNCGRGKSVLCRYALPAILLQFAKKVVNVFDIQELNGDIDNVLSKHIISLDDIGTEELSIKYGERRMAFAEVMDAAEKKGKLVIVSTNLTMEELQGRYGDRVLDRIKSTTKRVMFVGNSLRR